MRAGAVRVEHDLFGIVDRLRAIDDGYFVVYDKNRSTFEVHHSRQRGDTFALSVPYPSLDERTVRLVRRTRAENAKRLFEEMDRENRKLEKRRIKEAAEKVSETL